MKYSDFTQENSAMLLIDHQVRTMKLATPAVFGYVCGVFAL
ncbi:hypothetical protein [Nostoc sp.]